VILNDHTEFDSFSNGSTFVECSVSVVDRNGSDELASIDPISFYEGSVYTRSGTSAVQESLGYDRTVLI
jgi:hypothetical protein